MIEDARVLREEFVPEEIEHRHAQINQLSRSLEPVVDEDRPDDVLLFGPTGSGKTCTARYTLERLQEEALDVDTRYVNCWQDYTQFSLTYRLLEGLDRAYDVHRQSTPKDELLGRLREIDAPYVVILDEVDQLQDQRVLYDLYQIPELTMVCIAYREDELFAGLDDRVASRLRGATKVEFETYDVEALTAILSARARWGLAKGAVSTAQLEWIADAAAGDARVAIAILRNAARRATSAGRGELDAETLESAVPTAREEIHRKNVELLNGHQRTLYEIIDEHGEIHPGDLYDRYAAEMDDPKSNRTLRKYLSKMEHYNVVECQGDTRARVYRVVS